MSETRIVINVVAFKEAGGWVAQCLQYDIAAQADTYEDLRRELQEIVISHIIVDAELGREAFSGLPEAPSKFWTMYGEGRPSDDDLPIAEQSHSLSVASKIKIAGSSVEAHC
ncbi:type II toxin-antitoxin system HicB family antitoxin [Hyphomicrobium sp.]|jgi:hypothetical protein|uniref:type II toxin-antitoxin system HicB family antitoxin n=1 Tax=Hyphomicrobium sp. TaxID=82 RepID=UPI003567C52C